MADKDKKPIIGIDLGIDPEYLEEVVRQTVCAGIEKCGYGVAIERLEDAINRRLMPEGMEWLRYDTGEPVSLGGEVTVTVHDEDGDFDRTLAIRSIKYEESGVLLEGTKNEMVVLSYGECVKRPAPKVLDADGVEIEVGDDIYSVEGMLKFHVSAIDKKSGRIATFDLDKWADPKMYTHRAPVLAADGRPLREGETVWVTRDSPCDAPLDKGDEVTVRHAQPKTVSVEDKAGESWIVLTDHLTHERPDSWERLEEDARNIRKALLDSDKLPFEVVDERALALVRRAKAMAERERGER